jgi:2-polyprenyl-3-methyl-5-hydroxy-6-metoxy-1,4-benzoquinol methylase
VCLSPRTGHFQCIDHTLYWRCRNCRATFIDARHLPEPTEELNRYRLHRNDPDDPGYRRSLNRLAGPLLERLEPGLEGLDYGCGPGPALARMLTEAGHRIQLYDPFFHPDAALLDRTYAFITCTEVAEHFHRPAAEFETLNRLLRPGGWLGIMTCFQTDDTRFADWHYRRDPTHVVFYREETFRWLAGRFDWACEIPARNVVLMRKRSG